jgi:hypothetical protein
MWAYIYSGGGKETGCGMEHMPRSCAPAPPHVEMTKLDGSEKPPDHEFSTKPKKKLNSRRLRASMIDVCTASSYRDHCPSLLQLAEPTCDRKELSPGSHPIFRQSHFPPRRHSFQIAHPSLVQTHTVPQQFSAFRVNWDKVRPETWPSCAKQP